VLAGASHWRCTEPRLSSSLTAGNMTISTSISRLAAYYTRHGYAATIHRASLAVKRAVFSNRMVIFYCDLTKQTAVPVHISSFLKVERLRSYAELSPPDLHQIINIWNKKLAHRNIRERFDQGASLWLMRSGEQLAGYGWTLKGSTIEPHYFPLAEDDVHLFDFHVFPQYRGQGMNPLLVNHILRSLAGECGGRALIEAAEWNGPQLSSLRKTPFRRMGWARKSTIFHRTIVSWDQNETVQKVGEVIERRGGASNHGKVG
jgi:ribosomal protein S18 acetylase RimI-like enzyme